MTAKRPRKAPSGRTLDQFELTRLSTRKVNQEAPDVSRFEGALVNAAIGDALGWPTEFLTPERLGRQPFHYPISDFVEWDKTVGGHWWGYTDTIRPGEYSDDTQLTLSVARSIADSGRFVPERFAYLEFPLWLHYERGGGRSIKAAARSLVGRETQWNSNFYSQGSVSYWRAGANGAAMRTLPIALATLGNDSWLIQDTFLNALISHGHPRGILGALIYGLAVKHILSSEQGHGQEGLLEFIQTGLANYWRIATLDPRIRDWIQRAQIARRGPAQNLEPFFEEYTAEAIRFLSMLNEAQSASPESYYRRIGALNPETKGSGVATVCAALYWFVHPQGDVEESLFSVVNLLGSDTDTIAGFWGGLVGADLGIKTAPDHLVNKLQDRDYILASAGRLHKLAIGTADEGASEDVSVNKGEAYQLLLAWEIGLHEMFWDAIVERGEVVHPALGRGVITSKSQREIPRRGYEVRIIDVKFECGQTARFHSRLENKTRVSESLAPDILRALYPKKGVSMSPSQPPVSDSFVSGAERIYR